MLKLYSWNVNGIRAAEKKGFLDWLAASGADVVAVQETKANPDQLSEKLRNPPGYVSSWDWAEKKGYSGVATYVKKAAVLTERGLGDVRFDHEGRTLIQDLGAFVLFNIYFPNGGRGPEWVLHKLAFYKHFLTRVKAYQDAGRSVVVCGDVNTAYAEIDLARPKENVKTSGFMPEERAAMGEFYALGLTDTFRHLHPEVVKYTWWDQVSRARERNVGWRLDYFFVSPDLVPRVVDATVHEDIMGSDHCPISLTLDV